MAFAGFLDSVGGYTTNAQLVTRWPHVSAVGAASITVNTAGGIDGGPCLDWGNAAGCIGAYIVTGNTANGMIGLRFKLPTAPGANGCLLHRYTDNGDVNTHVGILINSAGQIEARKGVSTAATLFGTGTTTVAAGRWYYLESAVYISATTGNIRVRLWDDAGVSSNELTLSALNTVTGSTATASRGWIGPYMAPGFASGSLLTQDHYIDQATTTTGDFDPLLGNVTVAPIFPNGPGTDSNGTIGGTTPAATLWQSVSETTPDDEVSYVTLTASGGGMSFVFQDIPSAAVWKGICQVTRLRRPSGSIGSLNSGYNWSSGTHSSRVATVFNPSAYAYRIDTWNGTGGSTGVPAWTTSIVNAIEFGFNVSNYDAVRVTQMYAEVAYTRMPRAQTQAESNIPAYIGQLYPRGGATL